MQNNSKGVKCLSAERIQKKKREHFSKKFLVQFNLSRSFKNIYTKSRLFKSIYTKH